MFIQLRQSTPDKQLPREELGMAVPQVATHCHSSWLGWDCGSVVHHGRADGGGGLFTPWWEAKRQKRKGRDPEWRTAWYPKTQKSLRQTATSSRPAQAAQGDPISKKERRDIGSQCPLQGDSPVAQLLSTQTLGNHYRVHTRAAALNNVLMLHLYFLSY